MTNVRGNRINGRELAKPNKQLIDRLALRNLKHNKTNGIVSQDESSDLEMSLYKERKLEIATTMMRSTDFNAVNSLFLDTNTIKSPRDTRNATMATDFHTLKHNKELIKRTTF